MKYVLLIGLKNDSTVRIVQYDRPLYKEVHIFISKHTVGIESICTLFKTG